jgi:thiopurine S-methyltransferase
LDRRFWEQKWAEGATAFHRGAVSPALERHARTYFPPGSTVLVPLCGKSHDLAWLAAQGFEVHGVEFVEQAAREFFAGHGIEPERVGDLWRSRASRSSAATSSRSISRHRSAASGIAPP